MVTARLCASGCGADLSGRHGRTIYCGKGCRDAATARRDKALRWLANPLVQMNDRAREHLAADPALKVVELQRLIVAEFRRPLRSAESIITMFRKSQKCR